MSYFSNSAAMAVPSGVSVRDNASSPSLSQRTPDRAPGVVEEVVRGDPSRRYRTRWDDGHDTIYTRAPPQKR